MNNSINNECDFDFEALWNYKAPPKAEVKETEEELEHETSLKAKATYNKHITKRIKSELALEEVLPWHLEQGACYHCISFGDVDSLSYLRFILKQQNIKYCLISTWCMSNADIAEMKKWYEKGLVGRFDYYIGEIFTSRYANEYVELKALAEEVGGRACMFRNHSKVMAFFGERFSGVIESSANLNTNPRCENTTITIDKELALFYKDFFDQIRPFNKHDFKEWEPLENELLYD